MLEAVAVFLLLLISIVNGRSERSFSYDSQSEIMNNQCWLGKESSRKDCGFVGITEAECVQRNCCWNPVKTSYKNMPWCFHKVPLCAKYKVDTIWHENGDVNASLSLHSEPNCGNSDGLRKLLFTASYDTDQRLHVKIIDATKDRYTIPSHLMQTPHKSFNTQISRHYRLEIQESPFSFTVRRSSTGEVLFQSLENFIYEDKYLEISTWLPHEANIFGLGENSHSLRRDPNNSKITLFARDSPTFIDENLYGVHPFYLEMRKGYAHGVPERLTYKVIGGILDFYFFTGPKPADVVKQYMDVVGRPAFFPRWSLGYHQSRYGYKSIDHVRNVIKNLNANHIKFETFWLDIDYMDRYMDFTFDPVHYPLEEMQKLLAELHKENRKMVLIIDPGIKIEPGLESYTDGLTRDIFIKNEYGSPLVGKVWPGLTHFPDFLHPEISSYWTHHLYSFLQKLPIDGLWIDMNEIANFCNGECDNEPNPSNDPSEVNFPRYSIDNGGHGYRNNLFVKTLPMSARHYANYLEYDVHSLYGLAESKVTRESLLKINPNERPFILSRSTFPGSGSLVAHWTGDNVSDWEQMFISITTSLSFQLFGFSMVGADVCGFLGNASEELCARWMALGSFFPFYRNHNSIASTDQEPYLWESVAHISRKYIHLRLKLLPHWYTLLYQAHMEGEMMMRPLFFEHPEIEQIYTYDRQFYIGSSLLVIPVLNPGVDSINAFFPAGTWYDIITNEKLQFINHSNTFVNAPLDVIPVYVKGGSIIPTQTPSGSVHETSQSNIGLTVYFDPITRKSTGSLYFDDGISVDVSNNYSYLKYETMYNELPHRSEVYFYTQGIHNYKNAPKISSITFIGFKLPISYPARLVMNGEERLIDYSLVKNGFIVKDLDLSLKSGFLLNY